jgi:hypothetical protein
MERQLFLVILLCFGLLLILDEMAGDKKYIRRFVSMVAPQYTLTEVK